MDFLEKDLETILYENYSKFKEKGLPQHNLMLRQVNLGVYGTADLIGISFRDDSEYCAENDLQVTLSIYITIYELKKDIIDVNALMQIARYKCAIDRTLSCIEEKYLKRNHVSFYIQGILIGKEIQMSGDFVFLADSINWLRMRTYKISFEGISFVNKSGFYKGDDDETLSDIGGNIMYHFFNEKRKFEENEMLIKSIESTDQPE